MEPDAAMFRALIERRPMVTYVRDADDRIVRSTRSLKNASRPVMSIAARSGASLLTDARR